MFRQILCGIFVLSLSPLLKATPSIDNSIFDTCDVHGGCKARKGLLQWAKFAGSRLTDGRVLTSQDQHPRKHAEFAEGAPVEPLPTLPRRSNDLRPDSKDSIR